MPMHDGHHGAVRAQAEWDAWGKDHGVRFAPGWDRGHNFTPPQILQPVERTRGRGWWHRVLIWFFSRPDRREW